MLGDAQTLEDLGIDLSKLSDGQRAALDHPVPVQTDYGDWLQNEATHDQRVAALGEQRAAWWEAHPDTTLQDAWSQKFGGTPEQPASLADVTPAAPEPVAAPPEPFVATEGDFDFGGGASVAITQEAIDAWNEHIKEDPADFFGAMFENTGLSVKSAYISSESGEDFNYQLTLIDADGNPAVDIRRSLNFDSRTVHHDLFQIDESLQGADLAKQVLSAQVAQYQRLGLTKIETFANIDVGGYAWARYGYTPSPMAWNVLRRQMAQRLEVIAEEVPMSSEAIQTAISRAAVALNRDDPRYIWQVADIDVRLPGVVVPRSGYGYTQPAGGFKLGQLLLLGTSWSAELDLTDAAALQRLLAYLG